MVAGLSRLDTLSATIGEEAVTIEDVYEPYLLQIGYIARTPRGRCVTRMAYEHLGIPYAQASGCNADTPPSPQDTQLKIL